MSVNRVRAAPDTTDAEASFPAGSGARSVAENSPAGTNVGDPVAADDTQDDVLTYSLSETDPGQFQDRPGHRPDYGGAQDHAQRGDDGQL